MRRGVLALGVLLAITLAVVAWRSRDAAAPAFRPATGSATHASPTASAQRRDKRGPTWFAQAGVAGKRIAGVVTTEDGAPVRGASVRLANTVARSGAETVTDADGRFDLGVQPAAPYVITAEASRLTAALEWIDARTPAPRPPLDDLRLVLYPCTASIHGTIHDAAGGVIPGARITIDAWQMPVGRGVEADANGAYELCVAPGGVSVHVHADGYARLGAQVNVQGRTRRDFELAPGATVVGRVVRAADKAPVAHAHVELRAKDLSDGVPLFATSDDDGRFEIDGVVPGRHRLTASAEGLATLEPVEVGAEIGGAPEEVVCELVAAYAVAGKVVERGTGIPVAGGAVRLASTSRGSGPPRAVTQADGSFVVERVLPGEYRALFDADMERPRPLVTVDAADVSGLVLEVSPRASIAGRVVHDGRPAHGVWVRVEGASGSAQADHEGRFTIERVMPGTYTLYAESHRLGAFGRSAPITIAAGEAKTGVELALDLSASIEGVVVDQQDRPVSGVFLRFSLLGGSDFGAATTAEDGRFAARALSGGGDYVFEVRQHDGSPLSFAPAEGKRFAPIAVPDGATHVTGQRIKIRYERFTISGRVVDAQGSPVADVTVSARDPDNWMRAPLATSAQDGSFTFRDLPRSSYEVRARSLRGEARKDAVAAGTSGLVLALVELGGIEGTLEGFTTSPEVSAHGKMDWYRAQVTGTAFRFRDLPPGTYTVTAVSRSEAGWGTAIVRSGPMTTLPLAKRPSGAIAGVVVDRKTRAPVPGIYCLMMDDETPVKDVWSRARTAADGSFRLERVLARVVHLDCGGAEADVTVVAGQVARVEVAMDVRPPTPRGDAGMVLVNQLGELRIQAVTPGGPAARAGLQIGDVLLAYEGAAVMKGWRGEAALAELESGGPGHSVTLSVERGDKPLTVTLVLDAAK